MQTFDSKIETDFPFAEVSAAVAAEKALRSDSPAALHPWPGRQAVAIPEAIIRCLDLPKNRAVVDPFCGSGMTGVAARRLGVPAYLGDVNPMATLLATAAMGFPGSWDRESLPVKVLQTGQDVARRAAKRLEAVYGNEGVVAWIWTRTVPSPSPEYAGAQVPLMGSFVLSQARGVWLEPVVKGTEWRFKIRKGKIPVGAERGLHYRIGGSFRCLLSGLPIEKDYIEKALQSGKGGLRMVAAITGVRDSRDYRAVSSEEEARALSVHVTAKPLAAIAPGRAYDQFVRYGLCQWADLFLNRQIVAIETIVDEILESVNVKPEVVAALMFAVSRMVNRNSALCLWDPSCRQEIVHSAILRDQIYMSWSFAEANPFGGASGDFLKCVEEVAVALATCCNKADVDRSRIVTGDVLEQPLPKGKSTYVSELPVPSVPVADDVVDFFYVWLREGLCRIWPEAFETLVTPKARRIETHDQLVAALRRLRQEQRKDSPSAFSVAVTKRDSRASTASEMSDLVAVLADVMSAGWIVTALWPIGSVGDKAPTDVVIVVRVKAHVADSISRQELRTAALSACAAHVGRVRLGSAGTCARSLVMLGGALRAMAEVKSVLRSDGRVMNATEVLEDVLETIEHSFVFEFKTEEGAE